MTRILKIVLPVAFIVAAVLASFAMIQTRPEAPKEAVPRPALLVSVATARREPVEFVVRSRGLVSPRTQTTLVSEVSGQISAVSPAFVSGGFFARGDVLIRIDPRNYETLVKRARAEVARARTGVATENALAGYAFEDWERLRELNAAAGPASELTLRKPQLQQALAELESREAELEKVEEDLQRTVIRAPYDGMVREKLADVGQYVNVGAQLARTFAVDLAEVRLPVTQKDLRFLDLGKLDAGGKLPVMLSASIGDQRFDWAARVVRSEGVFDASSRVLYVVAQVDDPYDLADSGREPLRMGTFVTAAISGLAGGELVAVPRHALSRGTTLWVVDSNSTIQPRPVGVVRTDEDLAYLDRGVADGEIYVTTPIDHPLPGMRVRLDG
jgi:RND family efflux transporter MFP subunit